METYNYEDILGGADIAINKNKEHTWKPFLLQLMISSGVWCTYFIQGLYIGASTVIVAQIRTEANSTDAVTDEMSSWLSSLPVISAIPFILVLPWLVYKIGRKLTYFILCLLEIIAFIIFYSSTNLYHVLISQVCISACTAAVYTFMPILITEYTSPKYRGIFLTIKSASTFWGVWVSNAVGTFFYWKYIPLIGLVCSSYTTLTVFAWPESPYWLAMKGRYAESAKSYRWLRGVNQNSEKELAELISSQNKIKKLPLSSEINSHCLSCFPRVWSTVTLRSYYKPAFICVMLFAQIQFSGKFVMNVYAIDVLKEVIQEESVAYKGMLILDGVTVFSMYIGCILSRYFKRRTLMLLFASTGIVFLYTMSIYLYLVHLVVIHENHVVVILFLTAFSISISCGPMILASSIYGEIVPTCYQTSITVISGLSSTVISSTLLKTSPFMLKYLRIHGYFLFFAISSTIILISMYIYLPETKDKTVHEINKYFCANHNLSPDQSKRLLQTRELK